MFLCRSLASFNNASFDNKTFFSNHCLQPFHNLNYYNLNIVNHISEHAPTCTIYKLCKNLDQLLHIWLLAVKTCNEEFKKASHVQTKSDKAVNLRQLGSAYVEIMYLNVFLSPKIVSNKHLVQQINMQSLRLPNFGEQCEPTDLTTAVSFTLQLCSDKSLSQK